MRWIEFNKVIEGNIIKYLSNCNDLSYLDEFKDYLDQKSPLFRVIEDIAKTGDLTLYDWKSIKYYIQLMAKKVMHEVNKVHPDCKKTKGETFEDQLESVIMYFSAFEDQ